MLKKEEIIKRIDIIKNCKHRNLTEECILHYLQMEGVQISKTSLRNFILRFMPDLIENREVKREKKNLILQLRSEGLSLSDVAKKLYEIGFKGRNGKMLTRSAISRSISRASNGS